MILDLVIIGLAVALDPLPLTAFLIILPSKRGTRNGGTFVFGWLASLAVVVAVTAAATGGNPPRSSTAPSLASLAVKMAVGVLLIAVSVRRSRRRRQPGATRKTPKWQAEVDHMSPWVSMGLAPALQPWGLIAAGAATVVNANVTGPAGFLALLGFCLLASATYLAAEVYSLIRPEASALLLKRASVWIADHTDQAVVIGSMAVGVWLVARSAYLIAQ